ncbi:MAG: hypothetical protein AB8B55_00925 [Mariniblastus sp.]
MRRKRKKRNRLSVSLFPFLAVLICTFGVLIIMLVMAVKSADDQATAAQSADDDQYRSKLQSLQSTLDDHGLVIEGLKATRPEVLERMRMSRANMSYLKDEIRKLKEKLNQVGEELVALDRLPEDVEQTIVEIDEEQAEAELEMLDLKIEVAKKEVETKRKLAQETGPTTYVIVPHKGGGGTYRRPIFFECVKDAIILQPSGIRLEKRDFAPPLEPGNMLDAALLATREYWQRYDIAGKDGSPYPLIVVRPDGAESFVLARKAMKSWDDEFGYELVESGKQLEFGKSDPQLNAEVREAIDTAKLEQQQRVAQIRARQRQLARFNGRGSSGRDTRPGLTVSGTRGGFVSNAGSLPPGNGGASGEDSFVQPASGQSRSDNRFESAQSSASQSSATQSFVAQQNQESKRTVDGNYQSGQAATNVAGEGGDSKIQNPYADLSIAKKRGSNWALPTQTAGATGYLRPVRLVCGPDFLEVHSFGGVKKRMPIRGETSEVIDPLIDEIWRQIESWGISGEQSYWKPQLRIKVLDGGQTRFLQLKGLLHQSGLTIKGAQ